jgi:hypothetical protein
VSKKKENGNTRMGIIGLVTLHLESSTFSPLKYSVTDIYPGPSGEIVPSGNSERIRNMIKAPAVKIAELINIVRYSRSLLSNGGNLKIGLFICYYM